MRGAHTIIPARFLTLTSHLCVVITLLWENQQSLRQCLPSQFHKEHFLIHYNRLVAGFASSLALILIEFTTFLSGLTMFSSSACVISTACHGSASIVLTYFVLDGWLCDWYWPIFAICSVLPACVDITSAILTFCSIKCEHQQLTNSQIYKGEWSPYLILAGVITTVGSSIPVGYNISVINTPADVIMSFCVESFSSRYHIFLTDKWQYVLWSSVVSIFIVGGCIGSILGSFLANTLGRKRAIVVTNLLSIAGGILFLFCKRANSIEMLLLGRLLVGLAAGLTTSIVPMYLTELAPSRLGGAMGAVCPMGVNVGVLVGQVMGLEFLLGRPQDWHYLISAFALLVIIALPLLLSLPESPKYLFVIKRNEETALKELSRLRGVSTSVLTHDIEMLSEEVQCNERAACSGDNEWTMMRVLRDKRLQLPLLLVCTMQAGQQTSGINAVFYYSQIIFVQSGLTFEQARYATIGSGFINVCTAVLMMYLLPKFGRRPLLLGSIGAATLLLATLAASMMLVSKLWWMSYISMVVLLSYVLVYGFGLGPIPYFIASELFEVGPRPAGMAWGSLANWSGNFLVGMSFPLMKEAIGPYSFLIFSGVTAALFVFQKIYFPETRGRTHTQVAQLCSLGLQSRPRAPTHMLDTGSA